MLICLFFAIVSSPLQLKKVKGEKAAVFFSPAAHLSLRRAFHLCLVRPSLRYYVSVSAEEITQMEEGTGSADTLVIHHSLFVATVRSG